MSQSLKTLIVSFKLVGKELFLMESSLGYRVADEIQPERILARFKIVALNDRLIAFDFNHGMNSLFKAVPYFDASSKGAENQREPLADIETVRFVKSFIEGQSFSNNRLKIRQVAQMLEKTGSVVPITIEYFFEPYMPNVNYKPKHNNKTGRFGYFETASFLDLKGLKKRYSIRFDPAKMIIFALSANTPKKYRQAIKEGVLSWNRYFDREIVQVIIAPAGVVAPSMEYNMIQWADWRMINYASVSQMVDPRTGEVLRASVFLPSAFASLGYLTRLEKNNPKIKKEITLKGFSSSRRCSLEARKAKYVISAFYVSGFTTKNLQKVVRDRIRSVVAHEVGHALGLSHNFAGSVIKQRR